ncbi:WD repeat protein [Phlyctema vagabunda]|uniref:WD repeat protein n=1 Tax=Phlyctema vagabunda TaxID=108571 RepID=A0ABR4P3K4_9HELO
MSTVLPPPSKRQRTAASERARHQIDVEEVEDGRSVRIQFYDEASGLPIGDGPIMVSMSNTSPKKLELLLNTMQGRNEAEFIPYRFSLRHLPSKTSTQTQTPLITSLNDAIMAGAGHAPEDALPINSAPQAIFRVQSVTRCAFAINGHTEPILAAEFSPGSGSRLATGGGDKNARIWDCDTGTPIRILKGHSSWVLAVSWSPDESTIATGSMDNTVRLWDPQTGKQIGNAMKGHTKWVTNMAWEPYHAQTPGEPRLASASKDSTVRVWSTNQQKIELVLSGHKGSVPCVKWGGNGFIYTGSHDKTVKVWNAKDGTLAQTLSAHAHWVNQLALSTDFVIRTGYHDHTGVVPKTDEEKIAKAKKRYLEAATVQGEVVERLVSASDDFTMYLWEPAKDKKPIKRMLGHQKQVNHVTFSPDGLLIASAGFDNHTKIWSGRDGSFLNTLRGHVAPVYKCSFSPDSRLLVTGSKDTTLKVWDMRTHKLSTGKIYTYSFYLPKSLVWVAE